MKYAVGDKVTLKLTADERPTCKVKEINGPTFDCKIDETLDFS